MAQEEGEKLYYSIGEVAEKLGVNPSLIRYWEGEFPMLNPRKNKKGERFFTSKEIRTLELIHHLVKEKGFTLQGAKKQLRDKPDENRKSLDAIQHLKSLREELVEWKRRLREEGKGNPGEGQ